jgi:hypothetical protein
MGNITKIISDEWSARIPEYFEMDSDPRWFRADIQSNQLLKPIPKDYLNGVTVEVEHFGTHQYEIRNEKDSYVELETSSWVGISPGAVHTYGKLRIRGLNIGFVDTTTICGGYLGAPEEEFPIAFKAADLEIQIVRPITKRDLDHNSDRYYGYHEGEMTRDWWSEDELITEAKRIAQTFFPDYRLEINL